MSEDNQNYNSNEEENFNIETPKMNLNQFIYENIMNNPNGNLEINKNALLQEIVDKVEDGNNYIEQINSYFGDKDVMTVSEFQNLINSHVESSSENRYNQNQYTNDNNINNTDKITQYDLDYLSSDLPKDKNRSKILKLISEKKSLQSKNKNYIDSNELRRELIRLKLPKEKSIIKPKNNKIHFINGEIQYEEDSTSNTSNLKNFSPFIRERSQNYNTDLNNIVKPINKNKKNKINYYDPVSIGIENIKNKIINEKYDTNNYIYTTPNEENDVDYFFNIYKNCSFQNQSIKSLDYGVHKVCKKEIAKFPEKNKNKNKNNTKGEFLTSPVENYKSNLLDKIEIAQKNITSPKDNNVPIFDTKNNFLKDINSKSNDDENEKNKIKKEFSQLDNRLRQVTKMNNELYENKINDNKKKILNDNFIQIPQKENEKDINYEKEMQNRNLLNNLI